MDTPKPNTTSSSPLAFIGTSPSGHFIEAIKDALKQAAEASPEANVPWIIQRTGGDRLELGPISVTILINPGPGDGGGTGPHGHQ